MSLKISKAVVFFFLCVFLSAANAQQPFDKSAFYACMATDDINSIDAQLKIVDASTMPEKDAYSGTLLMKKAGLAKKGSNKLSLFKAGHKKLEASIIKSNSNAEFRFLRLMIQEHAPGILGYKNDTQNDSEYIKQKFKDLPPVVQHAVIDYSKKSKIFNPADF